MHQEKLLSAACMLCPGVQLSSSKASFAALEEEKARATQKTRQLEQQLSQATTKADEAAKRAQQAEASLKQLQAAVDSSKGDGKKDGNLQVGVRVLCAYVHMRRLAWGLGRRRGSGWAQALMMEAQWRLHVAPEAPGGHHAVGGNFKWVIARVV